MSNIKVVTTDYIEPDLKWEEEQYAALGVDFACYELKDAEPAALVAAAADADVLIVNMARIGPEVIAGLRRCKVIIRHGIGYDNVDLEAATRHGILVGNVPDYCVEEVAEQALMLMLACQRKLTRQIESLRRSADLGFWDFNAVTPIYALRGKTVGIVGFGRIGSTVFRLLQGFEVSFMVCDPYISQQRCAQFGIQVHPLDEVLAASDIVTLHTPLNDETHHIVGASQLAAMKPTAILINTARGALVDLAALDKALESGTLAMAGIDVYEDREPPEASFPMLHNPRAVCTPHLSWLSEEAGWNIRAKIVEEVRGFLAGRPPRNVVNPVLPASAAVTVTQGGR